MYTTITTTPIDESTRVPTEPGATTAADAADGGFTAPVITIPVTSIDESLKKVDAGEAAPSSRAPRSRTWAPSCISRTARERGRVVGEPLIATPWTVDRFSPRTRARRGCPGAVRRPRRPPPAPRRRRRPGSLRAPCSRERDLTHPALPRSGHERSPSRMRPLRPRRCSRRLRRRGVAPPRGLSGPDRPRSPAGTGVGGRTRAVPSRSPRSEPARSCEHPPPHRARRPLCP